MEQVGFDLGFERAGFKLAWQVEIDPQARDVLAYHWPAVPRFEDVRHCHSAEWLARRLMIVMVAQSK